MGKRKTSVAIAKDLVDTMAQRGIGVEFSVGESEPAGGVAVAEAPEGGAETAQDDNVSAENPAENEGVEGGGEKPASAPDAPPLADLAAARQREIVERMIDLDDERDEAETAKKIADKRAKGAEAEIEVLRHEMMSIVRGTWQPPLPFPVQPADPPLGEGVKEPARDEPWKSVPLSDVEDIPAKTLKILTERDFATLGDIAALQATGQSLTDIEGIGEKKATEIENALEIFWDAHPEYTKPTPPAPDDEVHTPAQLALTADRIRADEFRDLLINPDDKVKEVRLLPVTFEGAKGGPLMYVNVGTQLDKPRGVRRLARAWTAREFDDLYGGHDFDPNDSYAGVAVRCNGAVCVLGPRGDSLFVDVGEVVAP